MAKVGLLVSSLNNGGAERVVSRLTYILSKTHDVYLILFEDTYMCYEYDAELINLNIKAEKGGGLEKLFLMFKRAKKLKEIKKEKKLDVIISFMNSPNIVNILSKVKSCSCVVSIRNFPALELKSGMHDTLMDAMARCIYKKAGCVVPVTNEIADDIIKRYNLNENNVVTVYNPYDLTEIKKQKLRPIENTSHIDFMSAGRCIISVGRNMHQKGFWHLIKAFKRVHDTLPDTRLVIVGRNEMPEQTERLLEKLNLKDVVLLAGYQSNPFAYINRSEIYVLSSLYEGFPNSLVEAMACGKPVVAANCKSGPKEILCENNQYKDIFEVCQTTYGILTLEMTQEEIWASSVIEKCDEELAKGILMLLNDKKLADKFAALSIERASNFDYVTCGDKYGRIIENVVQNRVKKK